MDNLEVVKDVSSLKEKCRSHDKRIEALEKKAEEIPRLEVLMKMVVDTNEKQSFTLDKINENLSGLNGEIKNLSSQVSTLGGRVEKLEESEDEDKIDVSKLIKQILWVGIPSLVIAAVTFYIGWK